MCQDTELDAFKREIDMRQFAVSLGYEMDRRESWRGSTVLRSGDDKIVVKRNGNGHHVFFSVLLTSRTFSSRDDFHAALVS